LRIGLLLPQGYFDEFSGFTAVDAWKRTLDIARLGERLGFGSLWLGEHTLSKWDPEGLLLDCWTVASAVAAAVPRVELGFCVINSTFHNPAHTAKDASTLDAISGGRVILGLGAGFKENEAKAYGIPYPDLKTRLAMLGEHLEIISRMTRRDEPPFTFIGEHARGQDVVNNPRTSGRDHIPLLIGGHGKNVTYRLAAKYCDEIQIDVDPPDWNEHVAVLHERCAEIGRDPATLMASAGTNPAFPYPGLKVTGRQRFMTQEDVPSIMPATLGNLKTRAEEIALWQELGAGRLVLGAPGAADTDEAIYELVDDLRTAGIELTPAEAVS
jgi:alkanesulfonate monooxygenase SsuD/methylene tetrahydromethanopterin reductase-like flavin-dependent oxidoreductase (luciferase family)